MHQARPRQGKVRYLVVFVIVAITLYTFSGGSESEELKKPLPPAFYKPAPVSRIPIVTNAKSSAVLSQLEQASRGGE